MSLFTASVAGFCTFCDADAMFFLPCDPTLDGQPVRFCQTCHDAFESGQIHVNETTRRYDEEDDPFSDYYEGDEYVRLICDKCEQTTILTKAELEIDVMTRCPECEEGYLFTEKQEEPQTYGTDLL